MMGSRVTLWAMQLAACLLGVVAGLVPGLSFTAPFQGLYLSADVRRGRGRRADSRG